MYVYKIYFTIQIYCNGVISYAKAHTSIMANSEQEATKILRENLEINYNKINEIVELLEL